MQPTAPYGPPVPVRPTAFRPVQKRTSQTDFCQGRPVKVFARTSQETAFMAVKPERVARPVLEQAQKASYLVPPAGPFPPYKCLVSKLELDIDEPELLDLPAPPLNKGARVEDTAIVESLRQLDELSSNMARRLNVVTPHPRATENSLQ